MSVVASKRGYSKFEPLVKAQIVTKHILIITKNEKIFDISYKALTDSIIQSAEKIFIYAYTANNIYAKSIASFEQRICLHKFILLNIVTYMTIELIHLVVVQSGVAFCHISNEFIILTLLGV